jgi:hypothetical protein
MKTTVAAVVASLVCFVIGNMVFHRVLFAHIHLAGAGWAGMMILAVMSRLFPQPHLRFPIQARFRAIAFHAGLAGLVFGLLTNAEWYPFFGVVLAVARIWYAVAFILVINEFSQKGDRSTLFFQEQSDLYWKSYGWDSERVWL